MIFSRQHETVTVSDSFTGNTEAFQWQNPKIQKSNNIKESLLFRFIKETLEFLFIPP